MERNCQSERVRTIYWQHEEHSNISLESWILLNILGNECVLESEYDMLKAFKLKLNSSNFN